ncbi:glutamate N-acetyltransferase [Austwickia chelonae]|uniref:Arginine biosynthesis bifunctional protein ArgJ n=1 Tax=Austwickia chelonae NBRC 105200 TaxID=1184607 RepID=K6VI67_9MICO|nr:bifunctional glutamate N-acetyltransferase/amino-acid acetyltransferase ArgJ [Austwickia chelonae]GAB76444.1 arginine biosynthesis bifunctional protein ArgJ [Austwickia chelonae NBRC 105200]SEW24785.1 glutamate N-acetyltransferase [Austwickia chelonae]
MSVTFPAGFRAAGVTAGLKLSGAADVALVVNDGPLYSAAGVFTTNRVEAAPVTWSRGVIGDGRAVAVVLNSGCANACTGARGARDARMTAEHLSERLGCSTNDVIVCSTGLIGEELPMPTLLRGVDNAVRSLGVEGGDSAAEAIMTTDTVPKQAYRVRGGWSVGGMAKGAGMLAPGLATMLVVLTTDAVVGPEELSRVLREATRRTFERIDSDGCMSTNDTVVLLASGASGVVPSESELRGMVSEVCSDLARQLIADAEGARHDIAITVAGAVSEEDAVEVARAVARSNLFKCAVFGGDPNWGRIVAEVGTTRASFDPADLDVTVNGVRVCRGCAPGEDRSEVDMSPRETRVLIGLGAGTEEATVWTNDLTHDYIHENSAYST